MSRIAWLLPLAVALGLLAPASGDDKPDPKKKVVADLFAKLKEKRERGWNERYKLDVTMPGGTEKLDFQIDWKTGMFRLAGVSTYLNPHEGVEVYDGKQLKAHFRLLNADKTPKGEWRYGLITGTLESRTLVAHYWPVFFNRGVLLESSLDAFYPGHFTFAPHDTSFFLHKQGAKLVTLRTFPETPTRKNYFEYTFDPEKDWAVTEFRSEMDGETVIHIAVELKQWDKRWAPAGWTLTRFPNRNPSVTKVRVTSFATDVPVTEENAYDIIPPEGAKVGRSHYQPTGTPHLNKIERYEYEVREGKLVQISGPVCGFWQRVSNWQWGIVVMSVGVVGCLALRRFVFGRKV
ncbi:MAG: hypothetical protein L0241_07200 [Planctomycetia bacterium]|nr:hypothetical protein [Planctomycetia bacterium]